MNERYVDRHLSHPVRWLIDPVVLLGWAASHYVSTLLLMAFSTNLLGQPFAAITCLMRFSSASRAGPLYGDRTIRKALYNPGLHGKWMVRIEMYVAIGVRWLLIYFPHKLTTCLACSLT